MRSCDRHSTGLITFADPLANATVAKSMAKYIGRYDAFGAQGSRATSSSTFDFPAAACISASVAEIYFTSAQSASIMCLSSGKHASALSHGLRPIAGSALVVALLLHWGSWFASVDEFVFDISSNMPSKLHVSEECACEFFGVQWY